MSSFQGAKDGIQMTMTTARVPGGPPYTFMYRGKIENVSRTKPVRLLSRSYEFVNGQGQVETKVPKNSASACGIVGHTGLWRGQFQFCEDADDFDAEEIKSLPLVQRFAVLADRGVNKFEVDLPVVRFSTTLTEVLDPSLEFYFSVFLFISAKVSGNAAEQ